MVEGHPLMTWPDAFSFGQDDSDCSTAPPVGWSYLLVPKLSSVGGLVYLKGWRRRKSKSLVYERQPTRFNHKQTGFHNHKLPGGSRCGTEFLKPKSNADPQRRRNLRRKLGTLCKNTRWKNTLCKWKSKSCWSWFSENIWHRVVFGPSVTVQRHRHSGNLKVLRTDRGWCKRCLHI